jgi:spore maturation protein CgeB
LEFTVELSAMNKWRVILLDTKKENPNHYLVLCLLDALKKNPFIEFVTTGDYKDAINLAIENNCNLFFAFDGEQLDKGYCEKIKKICGTSIVWNTEDPYEININKENKELFDLVFTNDKGSLIHYGKKGRHLPLAASKEMHFYPVKLKDYRYDLFFAGTAWPNRIALLKNIENDISDINMKLALPTNIHLPKINLSLPPSSFNWRTPNSEFVRFSNVSTVVLSLHRQFTSSGGASEAQTPGPRLFEVAMAGGFQLIDKNIPGINDFFEDGVEYVGFSSPTDCIEKLRYYLQNPNERNSIALNAQNKVLCSHTYSNRVETIINELHDIGCKPSRKSNLEKNKTILIVIHNTIKNTPYGGVEIYQNILNNNLNDKFKLLYFIPNSNKQDGKEYFILDGQYEIVETISLDEGFPVQSQYILSNSFLEVKFANILTKYNVGLIHFQHFIKNIPSLPFISKSLGIKNIYSIHDYYFVTHKFNLINVDGRYDKTVLNNNYNIDCFLAEHDGIKPGSYEKRKSFWARMMEQMDIIHVNSNTTKNILIKIYPDIIEEKVEIRGIPFGDKIDLSKVNYSEISNNKPLEVLVLGNFTHVKGADDILNIIQTIESKNVKFHLYGQIAPEYREIIKKIKNRNATFYGEYNTENLAEILNGKHVSLHLSLWPETFCITLSEIWNAGIVPIVYDVGALGERVTTDLGYKVELGDRGEVVRILEYLTYQRDELVLKQKKIINQSPYETSVDHLKWITNLYEQNITNDFGCNKNKTDLDLKSCGVRLVDNIWCTMDNRNTLRNAYIYCIVPMRFIRLVKFIIMQIRTRGLRQTLRKIINKLLLS